MRVERRPTPKVEVHGAEMGGRFGAEEMLEKISGGAERKAGNASSDELTDRLFACVRRHAGVLNHRPRDARRTESDRAPVLGERIEVRVAGRVGSLPGHAKKRRHRGVQHEKVERLRGQKLVEVARAVDLRGERAQRDCRNRSPRSSPATSRPPHGSRRARDADAAPRRARRDRTRRHARRSRSHREQLASRPQQTLLRSRCRVRLRSTTVRAPRSTSRPAAAIPSPPSPPVTRYAASLRNCRRDFGRCDRLTTEPSDVTNGRADGDFELVTVGRKFGKEHVHVRRAFGRRQIDKRGAKPRMFVHRNAPEPPYLRARKRREARVVVDDACATRDEPQTRRRCLASPPERLHEPHGRAEIVLAELDDAVHRVRTRQLFHRRAPCARGIRHARASRRGPSRWPRHRRAQATPPHRRAKVTDAKPACSRGPSSARRHLAAAPMRRSALRARARSILSARGSFRVARTARSARRAASSRCRSRGNTSPRSLARWTHARRIQASPTVLLHPERRRARRSSAACRASRGAGSARRRRCRPDQGSPRSVAVPSPETWSTSSGSNPKARHKAASAVWNATRRVAPSARLRCIASRKTGSLSASSLPLERSHATSSGRTNTSLCVRPGTTLPDTEYATSVADRITIARR